MNVDRKVDPSKAQTQNLIKTKLRAITMGSKKIHPNFRRKMTIGFQNLVEATGIEIAKGNIGSAIIHKRRERLIN